MKRVIVVLVSTLPLFSLAACDLGSGGGVGFASNPYSYDGYYDGFYGPIHDGYWGNDNNFYYRRGEGERRFNRGDVAHFDRDHARGDSFKQMHGSFTPQRGLRTPHFGGGMGGGHAGGGREGGGHEGGGHAGGGHGPH